MKQSSSKNQASRTKEWMPVVLSLSLCLSLAQGQVASDYLYKGARSAALAGSGVATWQDSWAIFNNPAGLSQIQSISGVLSYHQVFNLSYLPYVLAAVSRPVSNKFGSIGVGFEQMGVTYSGRTLTTETAIIVSHGVFLQKDINSSLALGYSIKYLQLDYGQSAGLSGDGSDGIDLGGGKSFGVDVALQANLRKRHRIGVFVSNINRPKMGKGSSAVILPQRIQIGLAYSPYSTVWSMFSVTKSSNRDRQYHIGLEYFMFRTFKLMFGAHTNPNRFGAGVSIDVKWLRVDYSLLTHPVLPVTHQISLGIKG